MLRRYRGTICPNSAAKSALKSPVRVSESVCAASIPNCSLIAGVTARIELVPSVIILPARQTVLVAKQAATLDVLSQGRLRLGIGVGKDPAEFAALGADFKNRGARCEEQMRLLALLWTQGEVEFAGTWDRVSGLGLNPLPIQRPIPMWIGAATTPAPHIRRRIGQLADGWFVLATPEEFPGIRDDIHRAAHGIHFN